MKCYQTNCFSCQNKSEFASIIGTERCRDVLDVSILTCETKRITFPQFIQLMVSPLVDLDIKKELQKALPEHTKKLKTM